MISLRTVQEEFQAFLLGRGDAIVARVVDTSKESRDVLIGVYANAYRLRLIGVLRNDYAKLRALVGDKPFDALATAYVAAHPSRHFNARWFGRHLASFLATTPPYVDRPILAEIAAFEWALGEAFDAADEPKLTAEDLAVFPPEDWPRLRLSLQASVRRLDLRCDAPGVWQALDAKQEPPEATMTDQTVPWAVWRRDYTSHFRRLSAEEAWALDAVAAGRPFAEICEGLCEWNTPDEVSLKAASLLRGWVESGMIGCCAIA